MLAKLTNRLLRRTHTRPSHGPHFETRKSFRECFDLTQGMTSLDEASLLYRLAKETADGCIIEVGSYRGRSTVALGRGSLDGHRVPVYAVEPHEEFVGILGGRFGPEDRAEFFRAMLATGCYRIVRLVNLSSEAVAPNWTRPIGLLWIDGDHSYQGVKRDFECWSPHLTPDATIVFDDSLDSNIGPCKLIHELIGTGQLEKIEVVRKVTVLKKRRNGR